jgi:hypothetical protein
MQAHTDPTHTKLDAALAAAEKRFAGDAERAELIARTRRFKSSWIELAESLSACQKGQNYTRWGYTGFEEYYRKELHLKTSTVNKLVGSYAFLRKSAPEVLARDGVSQEIPSIQSIDFLRRAEEAAQGGQVTADLLAEVRRAVIDDGLPLGKVSKQFKETLFPTDIDQEKQRRRRETLKLAQRLIEMLETLHDAVPEGVIEQVEQAISNLLRSIPGDSEPAEQPAQHAA